LRQNGGQSDDVNQEFLQLTNVTHADEGWYTCVAGNSLGMSFASAYLKVVDGKCCPRWPVDEYRRNVIRW